MAYTLYLLTFSSGKKYVGQTIRAMKKRMGQHRSSMRRGSKLAVHCAWRLHGEPVVQVIGEFQTHSELNSAEISSIKSYETLSPSGYNLSYGGETSPSINPDVAAKIGLIGRGRTYSNTSQWSIASTLQWQSKEYRENVSKGLLSSWSQDRKIAASNRAKDMWAKRKSNGWKMSETQKEKLRNKTLSVETRKKMSIAAKERIRPAMSPETRQKISECVKESWANRDVAARRLAAMEEARRQTL